MVKQSITNRMLLKATVLPIFEIAKINFKLTPTSVVGSAQHSTRQNKIITTILLSTLICIPILVYADLFTPSHSCSKPHKPYSFTDKWQVDQYNNNVQQYKNCIIDFANEQNDAAKRHLNARADAIEEWNNFVNYKY